MNTCLKDLDSSQLDGLKNQEFCIIHPYTFKVDIREDECASIPALTYYPAFETLWAPLRGLCGSHREVKLLF